MDRIDGPLSHGAEVFVRAVSDFIYVEDAPAPSDVIFVPGAPDPEHAVHAAELYHQGYAPWVLPSGRFTKEVGHFAGVRADVRPTYDGDYETEWAFLRDVLLRHGVPDSAIIREDQATYTWDNALRSRQVTDGLGLRVRQAILSCKPWHARRALLYYQAAYPETRFLVCPASVPGRNREDWFRSPSGRERVLGEVRRCGDQVGEVFTMMLAEKPQAKESFQRE